MHQHPRQPDPVILKSFGSLGSREVRAFASLDVFVTGYTFRQVATRLNDDLAYVSAGHGLAKNLTDVLLDAAGVPIPLAAIFGRATQLGVNLNRSPWWSARYDGYDHDRDYRRAPVPSTGRRRWHSAGRHNWRCALEERRSDTALAFELRCDEELAGVRVRRRTRDIVYTSPWDWEPYQSRYGGKCWKNYRRAQWK